MPNLTTEQIEKIRWASLQIDDSKGRANKKEPNPDQKDLGLIAGTSIARNNYNYMFDQYHELFEQVRTYFEEVTLPDDPTLVLDQTHPVGSIYMSTQATDPSVVFSAGTWAKLENRFLIGASLNFPEGEEGGAISHTHSHDLTTEGHKLTEAEMPPHTHEIVADGGSTNAGNGGSARTDTGTTYRVETEITGGANDTEAAPHTHNVLGGILSGSSLPPYLSVHMWKRTA